MSKPTRSAKYKDRQLTRLQREAVVREARAAGEHQRSLKQAFLARNPEAAR